MSKRDWYQPSIDDCRQQITVCGRTTIHYMHDVGLATNKVNEPIVDFISHEKHKQPHELIKTFNVSFS